MYGRYSRKAGFQRIAQFSSDELKANHVNGTVYGYGVAMEQGRRPYMEDRHLAVANVGGHARCSLYGVFDGHGGARAAQYCTDYLAANLAESEYDVTTDAAKALTYAFKRTDENFLEMAHALNMDDGTTATVLLAHGNSIHVANAGDSRAVVVRKDSSTVPLSFDHKPDRADERERIVRLGGSVVHWGVWRVEGVLAVSRSIGDKLLKNFVIPDPEIEVYEKTPEDRYAIIATDGLWDVVKPEELSGLLASCSSAQACAEVLTEESLIRGTMDNVTTVVLDLQEEGDDGKDREK